MVEGGWFGGYTGIVTLSWGCLTTLSIKITLNGLACFSTLLTPIDEEEKKKTKRKDKKNQSFL